MLRAKQVSQAILREGARKRLAEVEAEREVLLQILGDNAPRKLAEKKAPKKRNTSPKHWTQTAAGRARMSKLMKAKYDAGWKARPKVQPQPTAEQQYTSALPETDQSTH